MPNCKPRSNRSRRQMSRRRSNRRRSNRPSTSLGTFKSNGELGFRGGEVEVSIKSNTRSRLAMAVVAVVAIAGCMIADRDARAERTIQIGAAKRTATVSVYIGKSEDV